MGGMGIVYLGEAADGGLVAVKVIREDLAGDEDVRSRFAREVAAAARVSCPWTARVMAADVDADPPYLVTEYVDGDTLLDHISRHGPLRIDQARAVAGGLAAGLATVHEAGVIHRDVSPANVLLTGDGPKLIDLGVAAIEDSTRLTKTGMSLGTPAWMAPEQARGEPVTPATDVFAWGSVIAFTLTGRPPFGSGRSEGVLYRIVHQEPDLEGLDSLLRPWVEAALRKDPTERPTANHLAAEISGVDPTTDDLCAVTKEISALVATAPVPTGTARFPSEFRETATISAAGRQGRSGVMRSVVAAAIVLLVAAAVGSGWWWLTGNRDALDGKPATAADAASPSPSDDLDDQMALSTATAAASDPTAPSTSQGSSQSEPQDQEQAVASGPERWSSLRFDAEAYTCPDSPDGPEIDREWQVSMAPSQGGPEIWPADRMSIGLRNKYGWEQEANLEIPIVVAVTNPEGRRDVLNTFLQGDQWADVAYPADEYDMWSGTHTVVWTDTDGRYLACFGFVVEDIHGE